MARIATMLLGVWVLYQLALMTWQLIPAPPLPDLPALPAQAMTGTQGQGRDSASSARIAEWNLFGKAGVKKPEVTQRAPKDAPDTRLNLVLRGLFAAEDKDLARAIIAEPRGDENTFAVGDDLPGGAELAEIYADRVILLRNGRHETLRLPTESAAKVIPPAGGKASRLPAARPQSAGELLGNYRAKMSSDPASLMELVRPVPVTEEGIFVGFRLEPGSKRHLFNQLGLQRGDIATEINGVMLDSAAKGMEVLQEIQDATALNITVKRKNELIPLVFQLPQS